MAVIDSNVVKEIIKALRADATIQLKIAKDSKNNYAIHPGNFNQLHNVFPQLTVEYSEGNSEQVFPSSHDALIVTVWIDEKSNEQSYSFCRIVTDAIVTLFNREGGDFNNLDVTTDTGVRICNFIKQSVIFDYDDVIKKHYGEVIFDVVRSEGESFNPINAGNKVWV